jgi:hypothetical protein
MTDLERLEREQEFRRSFEQEFPDFARMCEETLELIIIHQDAFAADYQEVEFTRLGRAIKSRGYRGRLCASSVAMRKH